jgi:periplasmic protein TonB
LVLAKNPLMTSVCLHVAALGCFGWIELGRRADLVVPPVLWVDLQVPTEWVDEDMQRIDEVLERELEPPVAPEESEPEWIEPELAQDAPPDLADVAACLEPPVFHWDRSVDWEPLPEKVNSAGHKVVVLSMPKSVKKIDLGVNGGLVPAVKAPTPTTKIPPADVALTRAQPKADACPQPPYPLRALRKQWQGVCQVQAWINADGSVARVGLHQSSGFDVLDQAALQAVQKWKFQPAERGGVAVSDEIVLPIRFAIQPGPEVGV